MLKMVVRSCIILLVVSSVSCDIYSRYTGHVVDRKTIKEYKENLNLEECTIKVKPCTPTGGRRIDGTCNNFLHPTRGSAFGPYLRLLPPDYAQNRFARRDVNGHRLPSARLVRTKLQPDGRLDDKHYTIGLLHFLELALMDMSTPEGTDDYLHPNRCCDEYEYISQHFFKYNNSASIFINKTEDYNDTCHDCHNYREVTNITAVVANNSQIVNGTYVNETASIDEFYDDEEDDFNKRCSPILVPKHDPYLRVTKIWCLNFARAITFQHHYCIPKEVYAEQMNAQTPTLDLSPLYGVNYEESRRVRQLKGGLLKMEKRHGRYVPPGNATKHWCRNNEHKHDICYEMGDNFIANFNLRLTTILVFFMRQHNHIAAELHEQNPCWDDAQLFRVARQINIAILQNIFMFEAMPTILGKQNMVRQGIINEHVDYIKAYDPEHLPLVYAEFEVGTKYLHTLLDGRIKLYNKNYKFARELLLSETMFRTNLLEKHETFEEINRGTFYQRAAGNDNIQDPEISERFLGDIEKAYDLPAADIERGRDFGVRGYNDYRHLCGTAARKFTDFLDVMSLEKVQILHHIYRNIDDIDLLAGIISEYPLEGAIVGPTLFCIMVKQLKITRFADRHWFERGDQYKSFSLAQLAVIRQRTMSSMMCDYAEGVNSMQPRAFETIQHGNEHKPCSAFPGLDLSHWRDHSCPTYSKHHNYS